VAQISLTITIPDEHLPRVLAGLRLHYGKVQDPPGSGTFRDLTQAELRDRLQVLMRDSVRNMVINEDVRAQIDNVKATYDALGVT
jgi:hypothetical protein